MLKALNQELNAAVRKRPRCAGIGTRAWAGLIDRAWDGRPNPALSVRQPADPEDLTLTLEFIQYIITRLLPSLDCNFADLAAPPVPG